MKLGNAGGGKAPNLWCAFEAGEVRVIGDEPGNTRKDPDRPAPEDLRHDAKADVRQRHRNGSLHQVVEVRVLSVHFRPTHYIDSHRRRI
jgi:hypothetical protein